MFEEIMEQNIARCVNGTNEVAETLEASKNNVRRMSAVATKVLASMDEAIRDHEYYHPSPANSREACELLNKQVHLLECCRKIIEVSDELNSLCKGYVKLTNELKARYTIA